MHFFDFSSSALSAPLPEVLQHSGGRGRHPLHLETPEASELQNDRKVELEAFVAKEDASVTARN